MPRVPLPVLLLAASLASGAPPERDARPQELEATFARLASAAGEERLAAQRWLARNLALDDWPALAAAARTGGGELRLRLVEVLASADRGLELALRAAAEPALAELGRAAFFERLSLWASGLDAPGRVGAALELVPPERPAAPVELDPERGSLGEVLDRLARLGRTRALLVLDPALAEEVRQREPERRRAEGRWRGGWDELLARLCELYRVEHEGHGFSETERGPRWVRVCKRGDEGRTPARELLLAWCLDSTRGAPAARAAAARALAATGWGEGLGWLERRWIAAGDEAALAGLLLAAGRGAVAPSLARPAALRALLDSADRALAGSPGPLARRYADEVARALARAGGVGPRGEGLTEPLLAGWAALGPRSRWLRLVVLEGWRAREAEAIRACLETAGAPGSPPALRLAAVRALDPPLSTPPRIAPDDLRATWRWALERDLGRALVDALERLGHPPLDDDPDAAPDARLLLVEWRLRDATRSGAAVDADQLARRLAELTAGGGERLVREELAAWNRQGLARALAPVLDALRERAASPAERARAARLALAGGALPASAQRALLRETRALDPTDLDGLAALALLCAGPVGDEALELFRERVRGPLTPEQRAEALALAEDALASARREAAIDSLRELTDAPGMGAWLQRRWQRERDALRGRRGVEVLERGERSLSLDGP